MFKLNIISVDFGLVARLMTRDPPYGESGNHTFRLKVVILDEIYRPSLLDCETNGLHELSALTLHTVWAETIHMLRDPSSWGFSCPLDYYVLCS